MLQYFLLAFFILTCALLFWTSSPYFKWKRWSHQSVNDNITVVTKQGREPFADFLRRKHAEGVRKQYAVVVPAYNEEKRLHNMLPQTIEHFEKMKYTYEIIIASDGSTDRTTETALEYADYKGKKVDIKVIEYAFHQGKGGAVRIGCIASCSEAMLMVDADGASDIKDFGKLTNKLKQIEKNGYGIVVGSRRVSEEGCVLKRAGYRQFLSFCSNFVVQKICGVNLNDTQCGFKLFTNKTAVEIFRPLHIRRWAFDVELFVISNLIGIPYAEVAINYADQDESKLNVLTDSLEMARDFILIRLFYLLGFWKISHTDKLWEGSQLNLLEETNGTVSPKGIKLHTS